MRLSRREIASERFVDAGDEYTVGFRATQDVELDEAKERKE